jgi:AcrR family transcriptional regulator
VAVKPARVAAPPPGVAQLSIADVVQRTGVPAATVHHYRRRGLLPAPQRVAPNRFLYDERHVQALRLIRALRERRGLGLTEIRRILPELLGLGGQDAFSPAMWDAAVGLQRQTARTKDAGARLLDAGRRAFVRHGFAEVRVDDVCHAAKVAKGSFYRYFRSKEELYLAACMATADDVVTEFERAAGNRRLRDDEATEILARVLHPVLSLFLDLLARAFQRHAGHARAARQVFGSVEAAVRRHLRRASRNGDPRAARIVHSAVNVVIATTIRGGIGADPLVAARI